MPTVQISTNRHALRQFISQLTENIPSMGLLLLVGPFKPMSSLPPSNVANALAKINRLGRQKYFKDRGVYRNPYPPGSPEFNEFERGWMQSLKQEGAGPVTQRPSKNGMIGLRTRGMSMTLRIVKDTSRYQRLLDTPGAQGAGLQSETEARRQPAGTYVLTGEKTARFGGGPSPYGFLIHNERIVGRVKIDQVAVKRGWF